MLPSRFDISSHRCLKKDIIDKTCPNSSDIKVAREFSLSIGAQHDFSIIFCSRRIDKVVNWMRVKSCILFRRNLTLKARQTNPGSPPELVRRYQVVVNVLHHYSRPLRCRPAIPNDNFFISNVHKGPGFSIVDRWTNMKMSLKRRT
jgi:hypothetical protein